MHITNLAPHASRHGFEAEIIVTLPVALFDKSMLIELIRSELPEWQQWAGRTELKLSYSFPSQFPATLQLFTAHSILKSLNAQIASAKLFSTIFNTATGDTL